MRNDYSTLKPSLRKPGQTRVKRLLNSEALLTQTRLVGFDECAALVLPVLCHACIRVGEGQADTTKDRMTVGQMDRQTDSQRQTDRQIALDAPIREMIVKFQAE